MIKPVLHAYFTDGFYPWAKLFVQSLRYHGNQQLLMLTAMDLEDWQQAELLDIDGDNLVLVNRTTNYNRLAFRTGLTVPHLQALKKEIELGFVTQRTKLWKLITSGEDRIDFLCDAMGVAEVNYGATHVIQFDIDTYFRGNIAPLVELCGQYDIATKMRMEHNIPKARLTVDIISFALQPCTFSFVFEWLAQVRKVHPQNRPIGFGQLACLFAYEKYKHLNWGNIPAQYGRPSRRKPDDVIWAGNVHKGRKEDLVKLYAKDLADKMEVANGRA